jgi:hypothetical protein
MLSQITPNDFILYYYFTLYIPLQFSKSILKKLQKNPLRDEDLNNLIFFLKEVDFIKFIKKLEIKHKMKLKYTKNNYFSNIIKIVNTELKMRKLPILRQKKVFFNFTCTNIFNKKLNIKQAIVNKQRSK